MADPTDAPTDLRYTVDHEWIRPSGESGVVGITAFAQDQLGDVVYLDLPGIGTTLTAGEPFGEVESVKTVSELVAPVDGEVIERNDALETQPELVNESPYGEGWLVRIQLTDISQLDELLDAAQYRERLPEA